MSLIRFASNLKSIISFAYLKRKKQLWNSLCFKSVGKQSSFIASVEELKLGKLCSLKWEQIHFPKVNSRRYLLYSTQSFRNLFGVTYCLNSSKPIAIVRKQTLVFRFGKWRNMENVYRAPLSIFSVSSHHIREQWRSQTLLEEKTRRKHMKNFNVRPVWQREWMYTWYIYISVQHFVIHHCLAWKCSDPNCPSQGVFPSSAIQALPSMSRINGYLYWSNCRAPWHYPLDFYG